MINHKAIKVYIVRTQISNAEASCMFVLLHRLPSLTCAVLQYNIGHNRHINNLLIIIPGDKLKVNGHVQGH
jgi:hypothetical protein